ncbi:alginate lyase family protein [Flavobacterium sp. NG2]|uniref:alginate lyase family protein n=1 Tax=Flavobacterium sp. NG2 TaxID=3097547 RepID=UPI002A811DFF|nr:alginate lyase family protein [Flavobacterium sp. NG2]WPR70147.1 alginate lyase family protein [Flavobacterium sp. NG2]
MNIKFFTISSLVLFVFTLSAAQIIAQVANNKQSIKTESLQKDAQFSSVAYDELLKVKKKLTTDSYSSLYKKVIQEADTALLKGTYSVMQKTQTPASGDKHDYYSIGPYWWPDPAKPDGLPWIRKDGKVNPLTREGSTDFETKQKMFNSTESLALAYFFSNKKQYATKALELIQVWFVNEDTKMNPNLNFAQGVPGENAGRGIGIIEFADVTKVLTAIEILELNQQMDAKTSQALRKWFTDYAYWLQTSENGVFEKNTKNNHGTHYDTQLIEILLFLNKTAEAKQILEAVKTERIAKQIQSNGAQPLELARTKALSYSTMNLRGFTELAVLGKKLGVDLWNYKAANGASIINAFEFLKPYAKGEKKWDYKQIADEEKAIKNLKELFAMAGSEFNKEEYCQIGRDKKVSLHSLLHECN